MSKILHMSDFHMGWDWAKERDQLEQLAEYINNSKIEVNYLVFTGDMIDARPAEKECVNRLATKFPKISDKLADAKTPEERLAVIRTSGPDYISFYDDNLLEVATQQMKQAAEIFKDFIFRIGVENKHVILCCGNHDRLRLAGEPAFRCDSDKGMYFNETDVNDPFEVYNLLCKEVNPWLTHHTQLYPAGDLTFLIANSNWRCPEHGESNQMCISCNSLHKELDKLKDTDKMNTIFISHKPYDDICEYVKFPYHDEMLTLREIIERTMRAFLWGDKHSYVVSLDTKPQKSMCGKPLSSKQEIRCNLIDWKNEKGITYCSYIINDGRGWKEIPITKLLEKVYNISYSHLKPYAFVFLPGDKNVPRYWDQTLKIMQEACDAGQMVTFSRLFASFCDLKNEKEETVKVEVNSIFEQIITLIDKSCLQSFSIKGRPGAGKSTFMSLLYLYMYWMFARGECRYMPFYFSLEPVLAEIKDQETLYNVESFVELVLKKFENHLKEFVSIRENTDLPICVFVDGLQKSRILAPGDDTIEKRIFRMLEKTLDREKDRYVMCFNTCDDYRLETSFDKINGFSNVLFMNRVRILPYKQDESKLDMFLTSYLELLKKKTNPDELKQIKTALAKFRTHSVDLYLIHKCREHILSIKENDVIWEVLKNHLKNLEKLADDTFLDRIDTARKMAGLLFSQRKSYNELLTKFKDDKPTIPEFYEIINGAGASDYLTAGSYVDELRKYAYTSDKIPSDSILFSFIPNAIAIPIRLLLDQKDSAANTLERFINNHSDELKGYLYSTIVYLCGHLRTGEGASLVSCMPEPRSDSEYACDLCSCRSYDLARVVSSTEKFPAIPFVLKLMDNKRYRNFNRFYQLSYYQDSLKYIGRDHTAWENNLTPSKGFDFRCCFLMLLSKLEPTLADRHSHYPLMELDLFTICDLVYSRLQYYSADGLFYAAKYNKRDNSQCQAVLLRTLELLKLYNDHYGGHLSEEPRIDAYFSLMRKRLFEVLKKVQANEDKDVSGSYVPLSNDFEQVRQMETMGRVGWNINAAGTIKVEDQPFYKDRPKGRKPTKKKKSKILESVSEHILESVYIAQLFLPEKLPDEPAYDKFKVISMILMAELGKANSSDYSPHYSNLHTLRAKETEALSHALVLGALDGYATQKEFFRPLSDSQIADINLHICWEIKMIQMEYKYYTLYKDLKFCPERRKEFENSFEEPRTPVCKFIREQLILKNPSFQSVINKG